MLSYSHRTGYVLLSFRCVSRVTEETKAYKGSIGVINVLKKIVENGDRCDFIWTKRIRTDQNGDQNRTERGSERITTSQNET